MLVMLTFVGITNIGIVAKSYKSDLLEKMAQSLNIAQHIDTLSEGQHIINGPDNLKLKIRIENQELAHIGFDIFDDTITAMIKAPIADFVERYWLSLTLPIDPNRTPARRMVEDGFDFVKGGIHTIDKVQNDSTIGFSFERNNKSVSLMWTKGNTCICKILFTINHEHILGRKMKENDRRLRQEILTSVIDSSYYMVPKFSQLEATEREGLYVHHRGQYLLPELSSDRYYYSLDSAQEPYPVFTANLPAESISNLLTGANIDDTADIELKLTHKNYEFKSSELNVNLRQFINFCLRSHCEPYVGIITTTDGISDVLLLMVNEIVGYNHLLRLKVDLQTLSTGKDEITGRINAYLPTSNLECIFAEYE